MNINPGDASASSCYFFYSRAENLFYLMNDTATGWLAPVAPGTPYTVENSQCRLSGTGAGASAQDATTLKFTIPVTFKPGYNYAMKTWGYADDSGGMVSGWVQTGTWTPSDQPLTPSCSASPNPATTGTSVTFTATVSSGAAPCNFSWIGAVSGSGQSRSFVPDQPGGYQASVTVNGTATASCIVSVADPVLAAFRNCIASGIDNPCQLPPGTYIVPPPPYKKVNNPNEGEDYLTVKRPGITVTGTMSGGPSDTVLRR